MLVYEIHLNGDLRRVSSDLVEALDYASRAVCIDYIGDGLFHEILAKLCFGDGSFWSDNTLTVKARLYNQ